MEPQICLLRVLKNAEVVERLKLGEKWPVFNIHNCGSY